LEIPKQIRENLNDNLSFFIKSLFTGHRIYRLNMTSVCYFDYIPNEIIVHIFTYVNDSSIFLELKIICKRFRVIMKKYDKLFLKWLLNSNSLWPNLMNRCSSVYSFHVKLKSASEVKNFMSEKLKLGMSSPEPKMTQIMYDLINLVIDYDGRPLLINSPRRSGKSLIQLMAAILLCIASPSQKVVFVTNTYRSVNRLYDIIVDIIKDPFIHQKVIQHSQGNLPGSFSAHVLFGNNSHLYIENVIALESRKLSPDRIIADELPLYFKRLSYTMTLDITNVIVSFYTSHSNIIQTTSRSIGQFNITHDINVLNEYLVFLANEQ
jgi:hypothetical protein